MNSNKFFLLTAVIAVIYLCGCENPVENPEALKKFSVTGFLRSDSLQQRIMVFKTTTFSNENAKDIFVTDAKVYLSDSGNFNVRYAYRKAYESQYFTNLSTHIFEPGKTYFLEVHTAEGIIKGSTCFPGDFNIESPKDKDTISVNENEVRKIDFNWSESSQAYGYLFEYQVWEKREMDGKITEGFTRPPTIVNVKDNHYTLSLYKFRYPGTKLISSRYDIRITAFDKNFYDHHFDLYSSAGLNGAYGYFASGTVKTISLNIK